MIIHDVPDEVINAIDANARRVGMSSTEYLRRRLADERQRTGERVTIEDLRRLGELARDLADESVMRRAWE